MGIAKSIPCPLVAAAREKVQMGEEIIRSRDDPASDDESGVISML
jgi:hypothetical protein